MNMYTFFIFISSFFLIPLYYYIFIIFTTNLSHFINKDVQTKLHYMISIFFQFIEWQECVPMLVDVALEEETGESVRLSSLQALTNLSVMDHHHNHYTRIIQKLYDFLDGQNSGIRLQAAKILVNLSCNPELVPHMLAAKVRSSLIHKIHFDLYHNPELIPPMLAAKVRSFLIHKIQVDLSCNLELVSHMLAAKVRLSHPQDIVQPFL